MMPPVSPELARITRPAKNRDRRLDKLVKVIDLFHFIDWVLHLPDKLAKQLQTKIVAFEEKQKMPYIKPPSLEKWGIRVMDAQSLEAVFADKTST
ncbi:MAG: hypothetical protein H7833_04085 [Magnetococcus sp. DMHC-1]